MSDVFLSYARGDDEAFVKRLYKDLTSRGVAVWWDRVSMPSRALTFLQEIRDAVDKAGRLIVVIGPKATTSDYVCAEWKHALNFANVVIPILRLGDYEHLPEELSQLHCLDFRVGRKYDEALGELLRILKDPVPPLGPLLNVPTLPPHLNPRSDHVSSLMALVLADVEKPAVITSTTQRITLQGMGGVGKSVLAATFARAAKTRRAFKDGVIWMRLGQRPNLVERLAFCGHLLNDDPGQYLNLESARAQMQKTLAGKACLLVLDDVWDIADLAPFSSALGVRSRLLITTRMGNLASALGALEQRLDVLSDIAAIELMAGWAGLEVADLPSAARDVARECSNLPLALAMAGAMMRGKPSHRWDSVLERLRNADLEKIAQKFPDYPYPDLLRMIQVSVDSLEPALQNRYVEFAVFPQGMLIPESVLLTLWSHQGFTKADTEDALDSLVSSSLITRDDTGCLGLHDLQYDYVRKRARDLPALHARLLHAYASMCSDWYTGPNDGYFFENLAYHLVQAGQQKELYRLLVNFNWLRAKLAATNINSLIADFDVLPSDISTLAVRGALLQASQILTEDPAQLGEQLEGRLEVSAGAAISALLQQVGREISRPRLRPITANLINPKGSLDNILRGHTNSIQYLTTSADGRQLLSASYDGTIRVWDLERHETIRTLKVPSFERRFRLYGPTRLVLTPDWRYAFCQYSHGYLWDALQLVDIEQEKVVCTPKLRSSWPWSLMKSSPIISGIALSADLRVLVAGLNSAGAPGSIMIWDLSGELLHTLKTPKKEEFSSIGSIVVSPNGCRAITASTRNSVVVWDLERGNAIDVLPDFGSTLLVMPDWTQALSARGDCIKVWNIQDGRVVRTLKNNGGEVVHEMALAADGLQVVCYCSNNLLARWDLGDGRIAGTAVTNTHNAVPAMALLGDGRCAVAIENNIWLYDMKP
ncbi:MAG TPA: NB-ARC domain-containing protein [Nitrospira sp.]|nr:NB-ARC domain-containing protein [Nitrospira sp.]